MNVTRRGFLRTVGAAGAAVALGGCQALHRPQAPKPDLVVAVLSDTHVGKDGSEAPARQMAAAIREINASPAEFTLILGDLVDHGEKNETLYAKWNQIARGLRQPFYAIPGNHDPPELFTKHVRPETDYVVDRGAYRFVMFHDSDPSTHDGAVTARQVEWVAARIDEAAASNRRAILCAHVPRHPSPASDMGWYIKTLGKELAGMLDARRAAVLAFFAGHLHLVMRGWRDLAGICEVAMPSSCWNFEKDLSKSEGFATPDFRPGYVLAAFWGDRLSLGFKPIGGRPPDGPMPPPRGAAARSET